MDGEAVCEHSEGAGAREFAVAVRLSWDKVLLLWAATSRAEPWQELLLDVVVHGHGGDMAARGDSGGYVSGKKFSNVSGSPGGGQVAVWKTSGERGRSARLRGVATMSKDGSPPLLGKQQGSTRVRWVSYSCSEQMISDSYETARGRP